MSQAALFGDINTGGLKCRYGYCPHRYHDVIGKNGWTQRSELKGAVCIPCLYANQMLDQGQTLEQVESVSQVMQMFLTLLANTGWTWQHVKDSYQRSQESRAKNV